MIVVEFSRGSCLEVLFLAGRMQVPLHLQHACTSFVAPHFWGA